MFYTFVRNTKYIFKNVGSKHNLTPLTFIVYKKKKTTYFVLMHINIMTMANAAFHLNTAEA